MKRFISLLCLLAIVTAIIPFSAIASEFNYGTEIEFESVILKGNLEQEFESKIIHSLDEINDFIGICGEANEFIEYSTKYNNDYFYEKSVMVIYLQGEGTSKYSINSVSAYDGDIIVDYNYTQGVDDLVQGYLMVIEAAKKDLTRIYSIKCIERLQRQNSINFTSHIFEGSHKEEALSDYTLSDLTYGRNFNPVLIDTINELDGFLEDCDVGGFIYGKYSEHQNGFVDFAHNLGYRYFDNKALAVIYAFSPTAPIYYQVMDVYVNGNELFIDYFIDNNNGFGHDTIENNYIVIELNKRDIEGIENITSNIVSINSMDGDYSNVESHLRGDLNRDGKVSTADYLFAKASVIGNIGVNQLGGYYETIGDVDNNDVFNAKDYMLIKAACLGNYEIKHQYYLNYSSLTVKGKDISDEHYLFLYPNSQFAELPVTAILEELGATVKWDEYSVTISYGDVVKTLNTSGSSSDFGYPAAIDTKKVIRKIEGDDVIFDDASAEAFIEIFFSEIDITIDFNNRIVYVE